MDLSNEYSGHFRLTSPHSVIVIKRSIFSFYNRGNDPETNMRIDPAYVY